MCVRTYSMIFQTLRKPFQIIEINHCYNVTWMHFEKHKSNSLNNFLSFYCFELIEIDFECNSEYLFPCNTVFAIILAKI